MPSLPPHPFSTPFLFLCLFSRNPSHFFTLLSPNTAHPLSSVSSFFSVDYAAALQGALGNRLLLVGTLNALTSIGLPRQVLFCASEAREKRSRGEIRCGQRSCPTPPNVKINKRLIVIKQQKHCYCCFVYKTTVNNMTE